MRVNKGEATMGVAHVVAGLCASVKRKILQAFLMRERLEMTVEEHKLHVHSTDYTKASSALYRCALFVYVVSD